MNPTDQVQELAIHHGLRFRDCGCGHVQIIGKVLVNYWPHSKRRTVHCPDTGHRESHVTPSRAVELAQGNREQRKAQRQAAPRREKQAPKPVTSTPADAPYRHLYDGDTPPWDESLGGFISAHSDTLRENARRLRDHATALEVEAAEQDELTEREDVA